MKTKTSITLSDNVLAAIDRVIGPGGNRSQYIENVLARHLRDLKRAERGRRDAEIYARMTDAERQEALDNLLNYGVDPMELGDEVEVLEDLERTRAAG